MPRHTIRLFVVLSALAIVFPAAAEQQGADKQAENLKKKEELRKAQQQYEMKQGKSSQSQKNTAGAAERKGRR